MKCVSISGPVRFYHSMKDNFQLLLIVVFYFTFKLILCSVFPSVSRFIKLSYAILVTFLSIKCNSGLPPVITMIASIKPTKAALPSLS